MKVLKRVIVALLAFCHVSIGYTTLHDEMRNTLGSMVATAKSGSYTGQGRGIITGGAVSVRNRISSVNPISFQPPTIKGGCGGIDFFKGSFGFASVQEFQTLLESIASNASGYAFQLAIDIVCPTCASNMKELQRRLQSLSSLMKNSCDLGKKIIPQSLEDAAAESRRLSTIGRTLWGKWDSYWQGTTDNKGTNAVDGMTKAEATTLGVTGNVVWHALEDANVSGYYPTTSWDQDFHEILMSLTGTIIVKLGTTTSDAGPVEPSVNIQSIPGTLDFKQFMYGADSGDALVLQCFDDRLRNGCLDVRPLPGRAIVGMLTRVQTLLNGSDGSNGYQVSTGIIAKLRDPGVARTFNTMEVDFISATSPGIIGLLRDFAHDTRAASAISDVFALFLAQELTVSFLREANLNIINALSNNSSRVNTVKADMDKLKDRMRTNLGDAYSVSNKSIEGLAQSFMVASYLRQSISKTVAENNSGLN